MQRRPETISIMPPLPREPAAAQPHAVEPAGLEQAGEGRVGRGPIAPAVHPAALYASQRAAICPAAGRNQRRGFARPDRCRALAAQMQLSADQLASSRASDALDAQGRSGSSCGRAAAFPRARPAPVRAAADIIAAPRALGRSPARPSGTAGRSAVRRPAQRAHMSGGPPGPVAGRDGPGRIGPAAAADRAGQALAARRVAGGIEPGHAGRAIVADEPDAADAAHRPLAAQRHRPALRERIDKASVERQKAIRLTLAQPFLQIRPRLVVLRIDRPFEQRLGDHQIAVASPSVSSRVPSSR